MVVGNPKPGSRTLDAATALADALTTSVWGGSATARHPHRDRRPGHDCRGTVGAVATVAGRFRRRAVGAVLRAADHGNPHLQGQLHRACSSCFSTSSPPDRWRRTVVVPLVTSGGEAHRYLADIQLRPVLSELGAVVPAPSLLLTEPEIGGFLDAARSHANQYGPLIGAAVSALATSAVPTGQGK